MLGAAAWTCPSARLPMLARRRSVVLLTTSSARDWYLKDETVGGGQTGVVSTPWRAALPDTSNPKLCCRPQRAAWPKCEGASSRSTAVGGQFCRCWDAMSSHAAVRDAGEHREIESGVESRRISSQGGCPQLYLQFSPEQPSRSFRERSATQCHQYQPQEIGVASCGAPETALSACRPDLTIQAIMLRQSPVHMPSPLMKPVALPTKSFRKSLAAARIAAIPPSTSWGSDFAESATSGGLHGCTAATHWALGSLTSQRFVPSALRSRAPGESAPHGGKLASCGIAKMALLNQAAAPCPGRYLLTSPRSSPRSPRLRRRWCRT